MSISSIIKDAYRELNLTPVLTDLKAEEISEANDVLQRIWRSLFGHVVGADLVDYPTLPAPKRSTLERPLTAARVIDGAYPANSRAIMNSPEDLNRYMCNDPQDGVLMAALSFADSGYLVLDGNGRLFQPYTAQFVVEPGMSRTWVYRADLGLWVLLEWPSDLTADLPFDPRYEDYFVCALARRLASRYSVEPTDNVVRTESWLLSEMQKHYTLSRQVRGGAPEELAPVLTQQGSFLTGDIA